VPKRVGTKCPEQTRKAFVLATLPEPDMIPNKYSLTVALKTDSQGSVNGVSFAMNPGSSQEVTLTDLTKSDGSPVT
jgi:hypothetical protein